MIFNCLNINRKQKKQQFHQTKRLQSLGITTHNINNICSYMNIYAEAIKMEVILIY